MKDLKNTSPGHENAPKMHRKCPLNEKNALISKLSNLVDFCRAEVFA
jgi:hypothetical protein